MRKFTKEEKDVMIEAMKIAGYEYDDWSSHDEYVHFFGGEQGISFDSWSGTRDWILGVYFDEKPEVNDKMEKIMNEAGLGVKSFTPKTDKKKEINYMEIDL